MDGCNQIETKTKSGTPVSISFAEDTKSFYRADHMLYHHTHRTLFPVVHFVLSRQRAPLGFLFGNRGLFVKLLQPLISRVDTDFQVRMKTNFPFFQKSKIMLPAYTEGRADDLPRGRIDDHLRLLSMSFFLSRIVFFLLISSVLYLVFFFFGRSTGLSVASTSTTSQADSFCTKLFLPGR